MTEQPEPIRKSSLPTIPAPEWEFHTWFPHPDGGGDMVPGQRQRGVLVRRRVSCGDWEPVRPDRWADEPPTDAPAVPAGQAPATDGDPAAPELTAQEARDLADELGLQLYRAEDALAFVEECCVIADREGRAVTTAAVREWLKGARCGRQLLADATDRAALPASVDRAGAIVPAAEDELTIERDRLITCINRARAALNDCKARGATGMQYEIAVREALGDRQPRRSPGPLCHETDPNTLRECALRAGHGGDHQDGDLDWPATPAAAAQQPKESRP